VQIPPGGEDNVGFIFEEKHVFDRFVVGPDDFDVVVVVYSRDVSR
jgi:hypothetical protein